MNIDGESTEISGVEYPSRGFSVAKVSYTYTGELEGTSTGVYLISYRDGAAPISGFERVEGSIGGHDGSFVLQHSGDHDATGVRGRMQIVEGLGTGALEGIRGEGTVELAGHSDDGYPISLEYDL